MAQNKQDKPKGNVQVDAAQLADTNIGRNWQRWMENEDLERMLDWFKGGAIMSLDGAHAEVDITAGAWAEARVTNDGDDWDTQAVGFWNADTGEYKMCAMHTNGDAEEVEMKTGTASDLLELWTQVSK